MRRAFDLAKLGLGKVSPNPMVGCVIVYDGKIVSEGWHQEFGGPHAEVNAVKGLKDKSLLQECTVYVSLEPCTFQGKTPPCTDLLIRSNVKRVVISTNDPNPKVNGVGVKKLIESGIEVTTGVLGSEGLELNRRFMANQKKDRPFVILKWAQTADGFIAREDYSSKWISSEESRKLVHKWRAEEDAVLVGRRTAVHDDPKLNVRDWIGTNPLRIVIDSENKLADNINLKDKSQPTIVYNDRSEERSKNLDYVIPNGGLTLKSILDDLDKKDIGSLIVEGGTKTLQKFIDEGLWDEARVFTSKEYFHTGISAPEINCTPQSESKIGGDVLNIYRIE